MRLAASRILLSTLPLLSPAGTTEASDLDFAARSRGSDYHLTKHSPVRFFARSSNAQCHYHDHQHCVEKINSAAIRIHARSFEGAHIDGIHVHYEKPGNVNHGLRILGRPRLQGAPANPGTDGAPYFTREVLAVPNDMHYDIHHYPKEESRSYYTEWVPRFMFPGE